MKKKIFSIISIVSGIVYLILSIGLIIPGMGIQSKRFIDSVEEQIAIVFPKNKYILDGDNPITSVIMESTVKNSFIADALSTLDFNSQEYNELSQKYIDFSNAWYEKYWQPKVDAKEDIDFYDIGMNMIEFDVAIAEEFQSFGYVNTGIEWIFHKNGIKEIFSSELNTQSVLQQTVIDQQLYNDQMQYTNIPPDGLRVQNSPGVLLVNNKTWFINQQIQTLKDAISLSWAITIFENENLTTNDIATEISPDDLYHPDFIKWKKITAAGFVIFISAIIISPTLITLGSIGVYKSKKNKGK